MHIELINPDPWSINNNEIIFPREQQEPFFADFLWNGDLCLMTMRHSWQVDDAYSKYVLDTHEAVTFRNLDAEVFGTGFGRCLTCGEFITERWDGVLLLRPVNCHPRHPAAFEHRICVSCSQDKRWAVKRAIEIVKQVVA